MIKHTKKGKTSTIYVCKRFLGQQKLYMGFPLIIAPSGGSDAT